MEISHIFVENGFDFLSVNYRGSIGYGSDFVTKLPGKCGDVDVSDCLKAKDSKTLTVCKYVDRKSRLDRFQLVDPLEYLKINIFSNPFESI